jgi:predicted nucleic acid-binding protein
MAEILDVMTRIYERPVAATITALAMLETAGLQTQVVDVAIGMSAGELHARHYDRKASPLSMADCVALATAIVLQEALATSDAPLAAAAVIEGVEVLGLPSSTGERPPTYRANDQGLGPQT